MKKFELAMKAAEALIKILDLLIPEAKKELESFMKDSASATSTYIGSPNIGNS